MVGIVGLAVGFWRWSLDRERKEGERTTAIKTISDGVFRVERAVTDVVKEQKEQGAAIANLRVKVAKVEGSATSDSDPPHG
jgi:hypothetical protein